MFPLIKEVLLAERVGIEGYKARFNLRQCHSRAKHMILVDAKWELILPNPAAPQFVAISSLVKQHISCA